MIKKTFKTIIPIVDFTYLMQLIDYNNRLYLHFMMQKYFKRNFQKQQKLVYTYRVVLIIGISSLLLLISLYLVYQLHLVLMIIPLLFTPFYVLIGNLIVTPVNDYILVPYYAKKAKHKLSGLSKKPQIIAITGSYGKTSVKNYFKQILSITGNVQMTPGNINTVEGVSKWILDELKESSEYLIVEMGAYKVGEIASICNITEPDYAVITALSDQHLKRFGGFENLVKAKLEIFSNPYTQKFIHESDFDKIPFSTDLNNLNKIPKDASLDFKTNLTESYQKSNLKLVVEVLKKLRIDEDLIKSKLKELKTAKRRGNTYKIGKVTVIDHSYNISLKGGKKIISDIRESTDKKVIIITGGIPEAGMSPKIVNKAFSEMLSSFDNLSVWLIDTDFRKYIEPNLKSQKSDYQIFSNHNEALENLHKIKEESFCIFFPTLSDLYY